MSQDMYQLFQTDETLEKDGVYIDYGTFRVKLARSGGANKRYGRILEAKAKPYRRAIQTKTMDNELAEKMMMDAFVETCIIAWEIKIDDNEWKSGVLSEDKTLQPFNKQNVLKVFDKLPDLFIDLSEQATTLSNYRIGELEEDAKN